MNKFLKLLLILAITPIILATAGFVILPSSVFAYIRDGKEVLSDPIWFIPLLW